MKSLFLFLLFFYLLLSNVSGKCSDNETFFMYKTDGMYLYGNTAKNCHYYPIIIELSKDDSKFNYPEEGDCVNRYFVMNICVEKKSKCFKDGNEEIGLLLCYRPNLAPPWGEKKQSVHPQYQLHNVRKEGFGCPAESKDIPGDNYQHGILFQHDGKQFIIKTSFETNSYYIPADNENGQKCFTMQMGNENGIATKISGTDGKLIDCGRPPSSNLTRDFDNRKDGPKLWQLFMDMAPLFDVRTYISSRGGGPSCGIFARLEGGGIVVCKKVSKHANNTCSNRNIKKGSCTLTATITKQKTITDEITRNVGEKITRSDMKGHTRGTEAIKIDGHTEIDRHTVGGTAGVSFPLPKEIGARLEFRYDHSWETQEKYESWAKTFEQDQMQHTEGLEHSQFKQIAQTESWTDILTIGTSFTFDLPPCHEAIGTQTAWSCGNKIFPLSKWDYDSFEIPNCKGNKTADFDTSDIKVKKDPPKPKEEGNI